MVPTLTILGRFNVATRGAAIPWFETALVTPTSMSGFNPQVISDPPDLFKRFLAQIQLLFRNLWNL